MALVNRPPTFKKSVASERLIIRTKNLLGPNFEADSATHLDTILRYVLPGCELTRAEPSHVNFNGEQCQLDSLAYMTEDEGFVGVDTPQFGAKIIIICDEIKTVKRPIQGYLGRYKMSTSPTAKSRSIRDAKKYSIGEMITNPSKKNAKNEDKTAGKELPHRDGQIQLNPQ